LDGLLPKLRPTSNQDGRQAKNRKKGDEIKKKIFSYRTALMDTILKGDSPRITSAKFG
jgi:hypothetical protein